MEFLSQSTILVGFNVFCLALRHAIRGAASERRATMHPSPVLSVNSGRTSFSVTCLKRKSEPVPKTALTGFRGSRCEPKGRSNLVDIALRHEINGMDPTFF